MYMLAGRSECETAQKSEGTRGGGDTHTHAAAPTGRPPHHHAPCNLPRNQTHTKRRSVGKREPGAHTETQPAKTILAPRSLRGFLNLPTYLSGGQHPLPGRLPREDQTTSRGRLSRMPWPSNAEGPWENLSAGDPSSSPKHASLRSGPHGDKEVAWNLRAHVQGPERRTLRLGFRILFSSWSRRRICSTIVHARPSR